MTLEELKMEVYLSLKVNDERLDTEALKNQELYAKYLDHKSRFELLLHKAKGDYKKLYREKWEYYGGKADAKVYVTKPFDLKVLKSDLSVYIESDDEILIRQRSDSIPIQQNRNVSNRYRKSNRWNDLNRQRQISGSF